MENSFLKGKRNNFVIFVISAQLVFMFHECKKMLKQLRSGKDR